MKQYIYLHIHTYVHKFLPNRSPPFMGSGSSTSPLPVSSKLIFISATIIVAYTHNKRSKYINLPYQPYYIHTYLVLKKIHEITLYSWCIHTFRTCMHTYVHNNLLIYLHMKYVIHTYIHTHIHYLKSS